MRAVCTWGCTWHLAVVQQVGTSLWFLHFHVPKLRQTWWRPAPAASGSWQPLGEVAALSSYCHLPSPRVSPWLTAPRDCMVACPRAGSDRGQRHDSPSKSWGLRLHHWCYRRSAKWQNQLDAVATLEYFSPVAWVFELYFSNWEDH